MLQLTQSTAATIIVGPVLDTAGAPYTGALAYTDFAIFKAGASAPVLLTSSVTVTHYGQGNYKLNLTASDTDTLGYGEIILNKDSYAMQSKDILIGNIPATIDALRVPHPGSRQPLIVPNALAFICGHNSTASDWDAAARRQFASGCNVFCTDGSWTQVIRQYASEADARANCTYLSNMLTAKRDASLIAYYNSLFGSAGSISIGPDVTEIPIALTVPLVGDTTITQNDLTWNGVSGDSVYIRSTNLGDVAHGGTPHPYYDSAEPGYVEVYHTFVQDRMTEMGDTLRELVARYTTSLNPYSLYCPNYQGKYYLNALAKYEEYVKWLRPVACFLDLEYTRTWDEQIAAAWYGLNLNVDPDFYWTGLDLCSRCNTTGVRGDGRRGYEAGRDAFFKNVIDMIRRWVPNCIVTQYDCYSGRNTFTTEVYGGGHYANFGDTSNSRLIVGAPELYAAAYEAYANGRTPTQQFALYRAMTPGHASTWPSNECSQYLGATHDSVYAWRTRDEALDGSYIWLTYVTTEAQLYYDFDGNIVGTYLTDQETYDLCYALGLCGAAGVTFYPGWHTTAGCPNNVALTRLYPQAIAGVAAGRAARQAQVDDATATRCVFTYTSGKHLYVNRYNSTNRVWNETLGVYEVYASARYGNYIIPAVEIGGSGVYSVSVTSADPFLLSWRLRNGNSGEECQDDLILDIKQSATGVDMNQVQEATAAAITAADGNFLSTAQKSQLASAAAGGGSTGTGARTVTITVMDDSANLLEGARVRMTNGTDTYVAPTNASGVIVFSLDDLTWSIAITKNGYAFTPTTLVVTADTPRTYIMTAVTIPASDPGFVTGYIYCHDEAGSLESDVLVQMRFVDSPGTGHSYDTAVRTAISDVAGVVTFTNLVPGAKYSARRGTETDWVDIEIAADAGDPVALGNLFGEDA